MKYKYSAIIPARNGELFLDKAIRSVLNQTHPFDQIIVVDDDSTDLTAKIACSVEWDGQIEYFFNAPSSGFVDAWNRSARLATGDYISILHQDDLLSPNFLERMDAALQLYPQVSHLYSSCYYINTKGNITGHPPKPWSFEPVLYSGKAYAQRYLNGMLNNRHIHRCPGVLTRRELLLGLCQYRKEAGHIADDDFFLRVGAFTDVIGLSAPLASYRNHVNSETGKLNDLTMRLARDYVFLSNYHRGKFSLLEQSGLRIIDHLTSRFINLLLFQGLAIKRNDWVIEALRLQLVYNEIAPEIFTRNIPWWGKPLWFLPASLARVYAHMIKIAHKVKTWRRY